MEITPCRKPWKGSMTARERFNAQMHYKPFDRTVNIEFGYWAENYETWSIFKKNGITNEGQANQYFAFDDALDWVWPNTWLNPYFENKVVSETETTRIIMNGEGLLAEVPKDGHDTIPHYIKASMKTLVPLVERGGFIPFCDHRCPPDVTEENYLYYLDLKEQMFGLNKERGG